MAVSQRLRYEVLRRDNHACKYCGASAPEVKLTVDHVIPVALGGSDDPSNLVTACRPCNSGKAASVPDAPLVADVKADALRWSLAMRAASGVIEKEREQRDIIRRAVEQEWSRWSWTTFKGEVLHDELPNGWQTSVDALVRAGLTIDDLFEGIDETMRRTGIKDRFRYFCGVCWAIARDKQHLASEVARGLAERDETGA